jgi:T-complex protein 1 subunit beta
MNEELSIYMQGSTDLDHIQIIKKVGGKLNDSYLDDGVHEYLYSLLLSCPDIGRLGFILDKKICSNSPKTMTNAKIMVANTCASTE